MREYKARVTILFVILILAVFFYLFVVSISINRPLQADEVFLAQDAQLPMSLTNIQHTPLYPLILRLLFKYCYLKGTALRLFSVACFFINAILVYFLGKKISRSRQIGLLGCILFLVNPLAIQGSLLLNMDYTILTVFMTLFILYFSGCYDKLRVKDCLILGFLFFLSLFSKETTPWVLLPAIAMFYCLRRQTAFGAKRLILISFIGLGLFVAVWSAFSWYYKLPYFYFLNYSLSIVKSNRLTINEALKFFIRLFLWLGPGLLLLGLIISKRAKNYFYRKGIDFIDFCLIYLSGIILGYLFVSNNVHQFLRYQYPILPIFAVILACFINNLGFRFNKKTAVCFIAFLPIVLVYIIFVIGDIIYVFNYSLKNAMVFSGYGLNTVLLGFLLRILSYLLLVLLVYFILRFLNKQSNISTAFSLSILLVGVCANLSLAVLQAKADYTTNYYYGRDIKEMRILGGVFESIKQKYPQGLIIGPGDVLKDVLQSAQMQWDNDHLSANYRDASQFLKAIEDKRVVCVVYSISWNTVYSYKNVISNEKVQRALKDSYRYQQIGTYSLWHRKQI